VGVWKKVAEEALVGEEEGLGVVCYGRRLVLFRLEDGIHVLDDVCSHEYSLLSEGEIWDDEVHCAKHGSRFNIRTGAVRGLPATLPVRVYPVKVEDGSVYVELDD
jgi:3-phenylpropionate/trans-cinnamate dioxygenase ferredoxin subunit